MEVNLGYFKSVFLMETLFGTSTVCLTSLNQSKLKVAYAGFFIIVYILELIIYYFRREVSDWIGLFEIGKFISVSLPLVSLVGGVLDYKTKISIALNLEAMENILESVKVSVPGKKLLKAIALCFNIVIILGLLYSLGDAINSHGLFTTYLTTIHYLGTHNLLIFPMIMFFIKVVMIQRGITEGFSEIIKSLQRQPHPHNQGIRDEERKWTILTELQGALHTTEGNIRNCYWIQTVWAILMMEITYPVVCVLWIKQGVFGWKHFMLLRSIFTFIGIVCAVELTKKSKEEALLALTNCNAEVVHLKRVKHQLLAKIHHSRVTFSCNFYDVDYTLLTTVLENFIFVATTVISISRED